MDSTLIMEYAEAVRTPAQPSTPAELQELRCALRVIGLSLRACEKSVQIIYERGLRPPEKRHQPWVTRVTSQLLAAFAELEVEVSGRPLAVTSSTITQAGLSTAVAWHFTQKDAARGRASRQLSVTGCLLRAGRSAS